VSDLYDADQSPLRVAHRHLSDNDWLYRICRVAAPIALVGAITAGTISAFWSAPAPLPPAAVPVQPPKRASPTSPLPQSPSQPSPTVDFSALRDRATNDTAALGDLRTRAASGNAEAQFFLATLYDPLLPNVRFAKDAATAADWYERSAAQSNRFAQNNLGWLNEHGQGRPKDETVAAGWYRKAAIQGDAQAQINLGLLYESGRGVNKDETEAARWYRMAADLGTPAAAEDLGALYESGRGVSKDLSEAARWYRKAADGGLASAQTDLGRLYENGLGVPKDLTEAGLWYGKAADQNNPNGQNQLGRLYVIGEGVPLDLDRALVLFRRAAAAGDPSGVFNLALSLDKGWGTPRNPLGAYIWYTIAARLSDAAHQSQAAAGRDRVAREISRDDLTMAQHAAESWQPGSHGRIGAAIQDLTPDQAQTIGSAQARGVIIVKVEDGGSAQRAGLEPQDVVTAVDSEPIGNNATFRELLWLGGPGQIINLWVEKSRQRGHVQNIRVQLQQAIQ